MAWWRRDAVRVFLGMALYGPCWARAGRATEAYLTVRRGARPSATQYWRMDPALQQTTGEKCGLGAIIGPIRNAQCPGSPLR